MSPGCIVAEYGWVFGIGVGVDELFGKTSRVELDAPGGNCRWVTSVGGYRTRYLLPRIWHRTLARTYIT